MSDKTYLGYTCGPQIRGNNSVEINKGSKQSTSSLIFMQTKMNMKNLEHGFCSHHEKLSTMWTVFQTMEWFESYGWLFNWYLHKFYDATLEIWVWIIILFINKEFTPRSFLPSSNHKTKEKSNMLHGTYKRRIWWEFVSCYIIFNN
jgi:hypothetical protein